MKKKIEYNVVDEYDRLIEKTVNLKRAKVTIKANPGSKLIKSEVKKWQEQLK